MPIGAGSSLHFLVGPVIAFVVLAVLALFMRWAFGTGYGRPRPPRRRPTTACSPAIATLSAPRVRAARCGPCSPTPASARPSAARPRTGPTSWSSPRTPTAPASLAATFPG